MAVAAPLKIGGAPLGVAVAGPIHRMEPNESRIAAKLTSCIRSLEASGI
jgi:hypothetical protein